METYNIKMTTAPVNWAEIPTLEVKEYSWGCAYRPEVKTQIAFVPGDAFYVKTACKEENPRATYTAPNSPVCRDSCMEFFASFDITRPDIYINFECNSVGCLLAQFGTNDNRKFINECGVEMPVPEAYRDGEVWGWVLRISLDMLDTLFGKIDYKEGTVIKANSFKCGDDTDSPHFGSWQPIDWPYPSFHRPQFFGEMTIVK